MARDATEPLKRLSRPDPPWTCPSHRRSTIFQTPRVPSRRPGRSSRNAACRNIRRKIGDRSRSWSPGTIGSCSGREERLALTRNAGTKKSWITSSDVISSLTGCATGTCNSLISLWPFGCCTFHIHCLLTMLISAHRPADYKCQKNDRAPDKHHHGQSEAALPTKGFPARRFLQWACGRSSSRAAAVLDDEDNNQKKNQRNEENRHHDQKIKERSTLAAMVDACSGNNGNPRFIASSALPGMQFSISFAPEHEKDKSGKSEHSGGSCERIILVISRLYFRWRGRSDSRRAKADRWANRSC